MAASCNFVVVFLPLLLTHIIPLLPHHDTLNTPTLIRLRRCIMMLFVKGPVIVQLPIHCEIYLHSGHL